jgi:hypothetical protein
LKTLDYSKRRRVKEKRKEENFESGVIKRLGPDEFLSLSLTPHFSEVLEFLKRFRIAALARHPLKRGVNESSTSRTK